MSLERDSIKDLASELCISPERIYKWRSEFVHHDDSSFQGHDIERLSGEGREVKEIQKKLRNTELELEILKTAIAFFSKIDM